MKRTFLTIFLSAFLISSCAGGLHRPSQESDPSSAQYNSVPIQEHSVESAAISVEQYGPELPPDYNPSAIPTAGSVASGQTTTPTPETKKDEPKLCLILGPGMAKAIAQAAVLEAIRRANIPVHCVVGAEMGAMVGALFSFYNGNTNNLQWQLFKLNKENYFHFPVLTLREPKSSGTHLNEFLRGIFGNRRIEDLPIKFASVATDPGSGSAIFLEQGQLVDALSASLAMPGIFDPWVWNENKVVSGAISSPAPIDLAKKMGGSFFVLIDVVEDSSGVLKNADRFQRSFAPVKSLVRLQKREASFVVQVKMGTLPYDDFSKQGEYLAAGVRSAEVFVPQLKAAWERFLSGKN